MKNIVLVIIFLSLLALITFVVIKVTVSNLPTIQFFINPTHKPTPTEELMLKSAHRNPSPAEFSTLYQYVLKIAYPTPYIEIGRCAPYPLAARVPVNTKLTFVNSDSLPHSIVFTPKRQITLQPKEKKTVLVDFYKYIPVPYGYTCDKSVDPVGILFII